MPYDNVWHEAVCRANPDIPGDLERVLGEISPPHLALHQAMVRVLPQNRRRTLHVVKLPEGMRRSLAAAPDKE